MREHATIFRVTKYELYGSTCYDIVYNSGRLVSCIEENLPATVKKWLEGKTGMKRWDNIYGRIEYLYKNEDEKIRIH